MVFTMTSWLVSGRPRQFIVMWENSRHRRRPRRQPGTAPDEGARGQLLRLMASDAMRAAAERHFGIRLAFQNCHRAAVFRPEATQALAEFTTARAQLLNQSPELTNC